MNMKMKRRSVIAMIVLIVSAPVGAQTHQHGLATEGDGQFNPFVAADPRGGFYLVYVERRGGASNVMLRYSAEGKSFSVPWRVNDRDGDAVVRNENPPKVVVAPSGDVYVCWASERGRWKGDIRFARSTDGGKTFSPAITLNSDAAAEPVGHAFQSTAVDARGRVYVAWIDERNKKPEDRGAEIWLSTSEDGGKTFSRDRRVLADVCECCRMSLHLDAAGILYLSYRTVPRTGPMYRDIVIARSQDGGKTFTPTVVSHDRWELNGCPIAGPSFSINDVANLTVVWLTGGARPGLYYATSTDGGKSFSSRQPLDPRRQIGRRAQITRLSGGRLVVAWEYGAEKTFLVWGVLDPRKGLLRRSSEHEGVTYPVVATNGRVTVVAGMRSAKRDIVTYVEDDQTASPSRRPQARSDH
jgi:hypothetical protein